MGLVRLEDIQTAEFLVDQGKGLEALRLQDLFIEPGLNLVLLYFGQLLMNVVEVSAEGSVLGRGGLVDEVAVAVPIQLQQSYLAGC